VRFGNVLGSRGSVLTAFRAQLEAGGPITVTDAQVTRYFMTVREAVQLVIQAGAIGDDGEVLVLDMGEPVRIVDLAQQLIRLSGHSADEVGIEFSGLRAGEKLYEELLADADTTVATAIPQLRVAKLTQPGGPLEELLQLAQQAQPAQCDDAAVRNALGRTIPEYRHSDRKNDT
jgi:FlaA1/EpsC-like NDP-sugar epimerase